MLLFNTLSGKKELFKPQNPKGAVTMYNCGPTVYNDAHIGNLRTYIFTDTLRRALTYNGYEVYQVMNITDVGHLTSDADTGEDKMMRALKREGKEVSIRGMRELANFYTLRFKEDLKALNVLKPHKMPRATDHIKDDIALIRKLEAKGATYETSDGIYFDISKFPAYGKLGRINVYAQQSGARVEVNPEKRHPADFALWKFASPDIGFTSPWGDGFPGWHIECSAMISKLLGQPIDIHTGGIDHIGTHHNGEIAQSEVAEEKPLANYWLHANHLIMGGPEAAKTDGTRKMAKSGEGFVTLKRLQEGGIHPLSYRFFCLQAHYQTPLTFSMEAIKASDAAFKRLLSSLATKYREGKGTILHHYEIQFKEAIIDNLNTPQALAVISELFSSDEKPEDIAATMLSFDDVLGLSLESFAKRIQKDRRAKLPRPILDLKEERDRAREEKNWIRADELRKQMEEKGYIVQDCGDESEVTPEVKL